MNNQRRTISEGRDMRKKTMSEKQLEVNEDDESETFPFNVHADGGVLDTDGEDFKLALTFDPELKILDSDGEPTDDTDWQGMVDAITFLPNGEQRLIYAWFYCLKITARSKFKGYRKAGKSTQQARNAIKPFIVPLGDGTVTGDPLATKQANAVFAKAAKGKSKAEVLADITAKVDAMFLAEDSEESAE